MAEPELVAQDPASRPAVVTGASSGIGAATAIALAQAGFPVALGARRVDKLDEVAAVIRDHAGEAFVAPLDLTDERSVWAFRDAVINHYGAVDAVISNAGGADPGRLADVPTHRVMDNLDLNLGGTHRLIRAFVPDMIHRRHGDLVFVSSDAAVRARPGMSGYSAAKWGLEGMVTALQMELEGSGVRASIVRPGPTQTEMGSTWDAAPVVDALDLWVKFGQARHHRFLPAEQVAKAIVMIVAADPTTHLNLIEISPTVPVAAPQDKS